MTLQHGAGDIVDFLGGRMADARTPGAAAAAVSAQRSSAPIALFVAGLIGRPELEDNLAFLGYTGERAARLVFSAQLDQRRRVAELKGDIAEEEFKDGLLDMGLLKARLIEAGFQEDIADLRAALAARRLPAEKSTAASSAIGLVLLVDDADKIGEPKKEPTSLGLQLQVLAVDQVQDVPLLSSSIGIEILVDGQDLIPPESRQVSAVGITLEIPPASVIPETVAFGSSIGLRLEVPDRSQA